MITSAVILCLILAAFPALLFVHNLALYRPLPRVPEPAFAPEAVSILIPARNEEANIGAALESLLANRGVELEIVVLDDGSADRTAEIVSGIAAGDSRVRLESAPPLPPGWCGKPHACHELARHARHPLLLFIDADVRATAPDALLRVSQLMSDSPALALASGVPHEQTGTLPEKLIIPLIHFVLLGFLPLERMRATTDPRFGAGCGQLFIARRDAYSATRGHAAIPRTMHDGVELPRLFRQHGYATDLFDATDVFTCRMYSGWREVWHGFAKNAHEGLASPRLIVPSTLLLVGGQIAPFFLVAAGVKPLLALLACLAAYTPRLLGAVRFRQSSLGALLHPFGVLMLVAIQWHSFLRSMRGQSAVWRGRAYGAAAEKTGSAGA